MPIQIQTTANTLSHNSTDGENSLSFALQPVNVPTTEGTVSWSATDHTLTIQPDASNASLQVGQENWVRIVNKTGSTLTDGQAVYISGAQGNRPKASLAKADAENTSYTIGIVTADILNNGEGYATVLGLVRGFNTSGFTTGDPLWLSATTAGGLTKTKPSAPNHAVFVGFALNSTNNGTIFVNPAIGYEIGELHDVYISSVADKDILVWDNSAKYWKNSKVLGTAYFGAYPTNYSEFEADGTLVFVGDATTWEDLRVEPAVRSGGTNNPSFEKWFDDAGLAVVTASGTTRGVFLYSFDDAVAASEKEIHFTIQMPHAWDGTAIYPHVHWVGSHADTTACPRWGMEYTWAEIGATYGATATVYSTGTNITPSGTDPDVTAGKHYIGAFSPLTPSATQDGISSILIGRIFRNSSSGSDTYNVAGNKCGLLYIDFHYRINTCGSRTEFVK